MNAAMTEVITLGTFLLNGLEFGVNLLQQREVLRMLPVTRVPHAASFIEGVINLRGAIIPVVNLRKRFGMPDRAFDKATRILNIEVNQTLVVGFIVDSVGQVRRIPNDMIEPAPPVVASVDSDYISGVGKCGESLLLILDIANVLSKEEITEMEQMA